MLSGFRVLVIGGDARQVEVIRRMTEWDATVHVFGFDQDQILFSNCVQHAWNEDVMTELSRTADACIFPVVSCDEEERIDAPYTKELIRLSALWWQKMPDQTVFFTGLATERFRKQCQLKKVKLHELMQRDDVAILNSIPTAEGAMMLAIQNTPFTIHGSEVVVLGFGRVGMTLARLLEAMGANVRVGVNHPTQFARAYEMGLHPFYTSELESKVYAIDLLFNTIPSMIITAQIIAHIPKSAVLIDLASKPGGVDFRFAEKRGMKALLAPGLPGLVAPQTAGRILADRIHQLLSNSMDRTGE